MKKNLILLFVAVILLGSSIFVSAQTNLPNPLDPVEDFATLIENIVFYITGLVAGIAVLVFIWAGILYLTSGANPGNVQKANKAVLYAVIGLGIALAGTGLIALIKTIITG